MRIAICDDSSEDIDKYSALISECAEKNGVKAEITGYTSAKQLFFELGEPKDYCDILFQDIYMPEKDGMETARELRSKGYKNEIVFLTVSKQHTLDAFDVGAFNYIVKDSTTEKRLYRVISSAIREAKKRAEAFMIFSSGGENRNVPVSEIRYFEVIDHIIHVHYGEESFEFFSTIGKLENRLQNHGFLRINRSILVSKTYIKTFSYSEVVLDTGERFSISRGKYNIVKDAMGLAG
jgi:two-component system response regulator LytT